MPSLTGSALSLVSCVGLLFSCSVYDWSDWSGKEMLQVGPFSLHVSSQDFAGEDSVFIEPSKSEASLKVVDFDFGNTEDQAPMIEATDASSKSEAYLEVVDLESFNTQDQVPISEAADASTSFVVLFFVVAIGVDLLIGSVVLSRAAAIGSTFVRGGQQRSSLMQIDSSDTAIEISSSPGPLSSVAGHVDSDNSSLSEHGCHNRSNVDEVVVPLEHGSEDFTIDIAQPRTDSCSGFPAFEGLDSNSNVTEVDQQRQLIVQLLEGQCSGIAVASGNVDEDDMLEQNEKTYDAPGESFVSNVTLVNEDNTWSSLNAAESKDSFTCTEQDRTEVTPMPKEMSPLCSAGATVQETGIEKSELASNGLGDSLSSICLRVPTPVWNERNGDSSA